MSKVAPVIRVATKAKHLTTEVRIALKARRRAALSWLRATQRDRATSARDAATIGEWILALEFGKRPSESAIAWIHLRTTRGDICHRSWAKELLETLEGES